MIRKVIKFYGTFCWPCKVISPIIKKLCLDEWIMLEEVDVEEHEDYSMNYWITKVPTVVYQKENWETHSIVWALDYDWYKAELYSFLWK